MAPLNTHTVPLSNLLSTRTLRTAASLSQPWKRQSTVFVIPTGYGDINNSEQPGTVVGIVLGSVAGFLLLLWLLKSCFDKGGVANNNNTYDEYDETIVSRGPKSRSGKSRRSSRRHSGTVVEEMRSAPPPPPPQVVERVIIEERRPRAVSVVRTVRSERSDDDEVVVIEEHSPPRRAKSKRGREVREVREVRDVRESGYRGVDPMAYGGGDRPLREVGGRRSGSRRG